MEKKQNRRSRFNVIDLACGVLAIVAVVGFLLWPRSVELNSETYDITLALYRACNQQDTDGLQQIQTKLDELQPASNSDDVAFAHLQRVIDEARSGKWDSAMRQTRKTLDDQTKGR